MRKAGRESGVSTISTTSLDFISPLIVVYHGVMLSPGNQLMMFCSGLPSHFIIIPQS